MSDEIIESVVANAGPNRRQFLVRLIAGSTFAVPAIASFAIGGSSSPTRSPLDAGSNLPECPPGYHFDLGSNACVADEVELPPTL